MEIRPFRGWRYRGGPEGDVSALIAPPYDVLGEEDKAALLSRSARNIVAVDLPCVPASGEGPEQAYADAAARLARWQAEGALCQDERPALYVYEQAYKWAGRRHVRRAMIAGVRATPLGHDVIPHEHTFEGPKLDRLRLTRHTRMQLSPIFGFYRDPQGQVGDLLAEVAAGRPASHGHLRGTADRLWRTDDDNVVARIAAALREVPVYIADGHHRYATALSYAQQLRAGGAIDEAHEANFVMFALVARDDPGLLILPTHRLVSGLSEAFAMPALVAAAPEFTWRRCSVEDVDFSDADGFLARYGPGAMGLMGADPAELWIATLDDPAVMRQAAGEQSDAWRSLDVAVLHKRIIDRAIEPWRTAALTVEYTPDGRAVLAACRSGRAQLGVFLQGTPLEAVEAVADEGGAMPHKSTYFYPKLATGMVLKPLA
jgi:uncharacterized protein (DUF1015 family)